METELWKVHNWAARLQPRDGDKLIVYGFQHTCALCVLCASHSLAHE